MPTLWGRRPHAHTPRVPRQHRRAGGARGRSRPLQGPEGLQAGADPPPWGGGFAGQADAPLTAGWGWGHPAETPPSGLAPPPARTRALGGLGHPVSRLPVHRPGSAPDGHAARSVPSCSDGRRDPRGDTSEAAVRPVRPAGGQGAVRLLRPRGRRPGRTEEGQPGGRHLPGASPRRGAAVGTCHPQRHCWRVRPIRAAGPDTDRRSPPPTEPGRGRPHPRKAAWASRGRRRGHTEGPPPGRTAAWTRFRTRAGRTPSALTPPGKRLQNGGAAAGTPSGLNTCLAHTLGNTSARLSATETSRVRIRKLSSQVPETGPRSQETAAFLRDGARGDALAPAPVPASPAAEEPPPPPSPRGTPPHTTSLHRGFQGVRPSTCF